MSHEVTLPSGGSTTVQPVRAVGSVQCPTRNPAPKDCVIA